MSQTLALIVYLAAIVFIWRRDKDTNTHFSRTLWIPLIWLLIAASRPLSFWLGLKGGGGGSANVEGSAPDRAFYFVLIVASIWILSRRQFKWGQFVSQNKSLFAYYAFLALTIFWSVYPYPTFKRWTKELGALCVMLVILSEQDPLEAAKAVFTRAAYVLFPLSLLLIKYFPALGRAYSPGGEPMATGVTLQKNSLGEMVLVFSLMLVFRVMQKWKQNQRQPWRNYVAPLVMLGIGLWLLHLSDSKTGMICLVAGSIILCAQRLPLLKNHPRRVVMIFAIALPVLYLANSVFPVTETLLRLVGRDPTLTHRTEIWAAVQQHPVNPIFGIGFLNYWDVYRTITLGNRNVHLETAHNGYLETYLDGGALGVIFLAIMLISVGIRVARNYCRGSSMAMLALAFYTATVLANCSESLYARRTPLWLAFLLFCVKAPTPHRQPRSTTAGRETDGYLQPAAAGIDEVEEFSRF